MINIVQFMRNKRHINNKQKFQLICGHFIANSDFYCDSAVQIYRRYAVFYLDPEHFGGGRFCESLGMKIETKGECVVGV